MLFAYMAGGEGVGGLEVLKCFVRGGQNFFYLFCVWGGRGRFRFSTSASVKKITDPAPINKWLVPITKSLKGHYVAYLFLRYFLFILHPPAGDK